MKTRLLRVGGALPFVNGLAARHHVGVGHARARAERRRVHGRFERAGSALTHELGLGRVHPPRVDALAEERLVHLVPEQLPRLGVEGVVEAVDVVEPVRRRTLERLWIQEPSRLERLEVLGRGVELRPDGDHQPGVPALVDLADPARGVGEPLRVELVRAPLVGLPVLPVHHHRVERDPALPELGERVERLLRRAVALAALPQPEREARDERRAPGQPPVAGDHVVEVGAVDEPVVDPVADLGPERRGVRPGRRLPLQPQRALALVAPPLEPDLVALAAFGDEPERVPPRQPALAPGVDDELVVEPQPHAVVGERHEVVGAGGVEPDRAVPGHARVALRELRVELRHRDLRRVVDGRDRRAILRRAERDLRVHTRRDDVPALAAPLAVRPGEAARAALGVEEVRRRHMDGLARVAELRVRGVVPQQTVAAARREERHDVHDVVLVQVHVAARVVHPAVLMRPEPVERLASLRLELGPHVEGLLAHDLGRRERAAAGLLGKQSATLAIEERDGPTRQRDPRREPLGRHVHSARSRLHLECRRLAGVGHGHERLAREERASRRVHHAHEIVPAHAKLQPTIAHLQGDPVLQALGRLSARPGRRVRRAAASRGNDDEPPRGVVEESAA